MPDSTADFVSVIMPAYNAEAYIEQAIESILAQSYSHFELIISDDGSSDHTIDQVLRFQDSRIRLLKQKQNLGYVENMNVLLKAAKGKYLMIQDADDFSDKRRIEVLLHFLSTHPTIDMVGSSYVKLEDGKEEQVHLPVSSEEIEQAFTEYADTLPVLNGAVMFKRTIVDKGFLFRSLQFVGRGQDDDWLFRVSEQFALSNVKEVLYYYRSNSSSMTLNPSLINYYSIFASEYVRFLSKLRKEQGIDLLEQRKVQEIEQFFQRKKRTLTDKEPAYLESYVAHRYLGIGKRGNAIQWFIKALLKNPGNTFLWKKLLFVLLNRQQP